jgi:hypothetical protein
MAANDRIVVGCTWPICTRRRTPSWQGGVHNRRQLTAGSLPCAVGCAYRVQARRLPLGWVGSPSRRERCDRHQQAISERSPAQDGPGKERMPNALISERVFGNVDPVLARQRPIAARTSLTEWWLGGKLVKFRYHKRIDDLRPGAMQIGDGTIEQRGDCRIRGIGWECLTQDANSPPSCAAPGPRMPHNWAEIASASSAVAGSAASELRCNGRRRLPNKSTA